MEVGRLSRIANVTPRRQLQEGRRKGAHGGDREDAGPALDPSCAGGSPEEWGEASRAVPGKVAKEGGSFDTEAPANLDPDNDQARPSCGLEFGVRLAPLTASGGLDGRARARGGTRLRLPVPRDRTDERGVKRELRPVPKGQAVCDDLNATRVADGNIDVHVCEPDVAGNSRAAFPAHAGDRMLER